jgi:hypothetical protein
MNKSVLAFVSGFRLVARQPVITCLVVASGWFGVVAQAQQRPIDPPHPAGWVVIPVEEYRVLRAKAYPVEHDPEPPPLDATLTRVDYELHVLGDLAAGRANLTIDVLKDGWVRVPVPTGLLVREARLDGKLVSLVPGAPGRGTHVCALLSHSGRSVLALEVDVPVSTSPAEESLSLPSTDSGVTRAAVQLPRTGIDLRVGGGLLSERTETTAETKWLAYGRGNEALTFTWRKKAEDHQVELPLRLRGSLTQLISLGEDATAVYAEVALEVVQGVTREVHISLPEKITVNQVSGAVVADWETKNGELVVSFLEPVEHSARFVINGEASLAKDGHIDIPMLRLGHSERDSGGVAVEILGAGEIKQQSAQGLEEADASDLGTAIASRQSPALVAFRARPGAAGATRTLSVTVARYDQQRILMANIEEARYRVLLSADGKELVEARYAVRNNQRNFLKITLPEGAIVWSASLAGKPVRPGQSPDGSLLLPLEKSRGADDAPAFEVEILYATKTAPWEEKGHERVTLPSVDLPISRTGLLLYYPPRFRITAEPGTFRSEEYHNPVSSVLARANGSATTASVASDSLVADKQHQPDNKDVSRAWLDSLQAKSSAGNVTGILPVSVRFPAFGPSIFLVSELTSENQSAAAEFSVQREKKGGVR